MSITLPQGTPDVVRINALQLILPLLSGAQWPTDEPNEPVLQPVELSLEIQHDTRAAASSDDIESCIDYSKLARGIQKKLSAEPVYDSLDHVADTVCQLIVEKYTGAFEHFQLTIVQPKASLLCEALVASYTSELVHGQWHVSEVKHTIKGLRCPTIIGIHPHEREARQETRVTVDFWSRDVRHVANLPEGRGLVRSLYEAIYHSQYLTLEALASYVAKLMISVVSDGTIAFDVKVNASKPHAIPLAASAEVVIHRTPGDFPADTLSPPAEEETSPLDFHVTKTGVNHIAVLALGSNLGDRFRHIEYALRLLEIPRELLEEEGEHREGASPMQLTVVNTSFLYETKAMYVTDQPAFINGACVVETNLSPLTLLRLVKKVEEVVGRVPSIRHGPRAVDIDIIFYGSLVYDTRPSARKNDLNLYENQLIIPHARLAEREFVLRPVLDMIPDFIHPALNKTVRQLAENLEAPMEDWLMLRAVPFPKLPLSPSDVSLYPSILPVPSTAAYWTYSTETRKGFKTHVMATLNTTPDSFSDGSKHNNLLSAMEYVRDSVSAGADIVDIGGYSTRPNAPFVSVEDELERVIPFVKAIRSGQPQTTSEETTGANQVENILLSVDTFRPEVAEAAIAAGVNCINDVYAFMGPDSYQESDEGKVVSSVVTARMKATARKYSTPVMLMHSRGDAGQNKDYSMYNYAGEDAVIEGIRVELGGKVEKIVTGKGGVRRWLVIVDPGIGFSKTVQGNLHTLKNAAKVTADVVIGHGETQKRNPLRGYSQLIGVSRKSFLGKILAEGENARETTPTERTWATAAAVTCAVQQGAVSVRVHDVKKMADVVKIADALWR
ncbi:Dihydropteroate synthase [Ephemerocybe angulata]|uniref:Dihydropteroate synthase n=1 Tax=Ephemerocybe angulata TaxID=980116 RepID=A0A8H6HR56_9AGAR|nr:Dihydropteroate synthase [Tulosesus angulatus]